jgi:hypothetical protein
MHMMQSRRDFLAGLSAGARRGWLGLSDLSLMRDR